MADDVSLGRTAEVLTSLTYHRDIVAYLKEVEPEVWAWASSFTAQEDHRNDTRRALLRDTYRLSPDSHPQVYEACASVMAALGVEAEATLYQAQGQGMNAALYFLPGEAHLVLQGPILERLSDEEVLALLGHELAHYRLWSMERGDFHTASRILDHTLADGAPAASHVNTHRLYGLYTELFADRGAAVAAASPEAAISTLVKVHTGAATADAAAYLRQAEDLERGGEEISQGFSHPETFIRAQALDKWWRGEPELDSWLSRRLRGPLSPGKLDLLDQTELQSLTRRFIARFLEDEAMSSEPVLIQARSYFPDWSAAEATLDPAELEAMNLDPEARDYLGYVMLDLALADPELKDHALQRAARTADEMHRLEPFLESLRRDAGLTKREVEALGRKLKAKA